MVFAARECGMEERVRKSLVDERERLATARMLERGCADAGQTDGFLHASDDA
jgi:hypothetical protein